MAVFFSFHYSRDSWRVQQVLKMGALEGQPVLKPQEWEDAKKKAGGIQNWIDEKMKNKSAVVVLVGNETASRPWVQYEIKKAWKDKRPLVGIRIHRLKDGAEKTDTAGANPFDVTIDGTKLSTYVTLHDPAGADSQAVYATIKSNLKTWADGAYKRP